MKISYCTTCKGRLHHLKETLAVNLPQTRVDEIDIVVLDYFSNDGILQYLNDHFGEYLQDGRLKYFRLKEDRFFDMSHAKNMAHRLATGMVLFNLDADNYIGCTVSELQQLSKRQILVKREAGTPGRIGVHRDVFHFLRGYDEAMQGMGPDDGDFVTRAIYQHFHPVRSEDTTVPIQHSINDKMTYVQNKRSLIENKDWLSRHRPNRKVNPDGYGCGVVVDAQGNEITLSRID